MNIQAGMLKNVGNCKGQALLFHRAIESVGWLLGARPTHEKQDNLKLKP